MQVKSKVVAQKPFGRLIHFGYRIGATGVSLIVQVDGAEVEE
jgi:hypothetical protein